MPRSPRYHAPGAVHHVMIRGNQGRPVFFSDEDRCRCCLLLQEGIERFGHRIHAFCLMTNHIHLAIQEGDESLSKAIQNFSFRYAQRVNRIRKEVGHVFQGRFKAVRVDSQRYLLQLVRYIHLNPVRAGMVLKPEEYKWSGHNAYTGKDPLVWLERDYVLSNLSNERLEAIKQYNEFIYAGIGVDPEVDFQMGNQSGILGDDSFIKKVLKEADSKKHEGHKLTVSELIKELCSRYNLSSHELASSSKLRELSHVRGMLAFLVRRSTNLTLVDLAKILNRDAAGLSHLAIRFEKRCKDSKELQLEIEGLTKEYFCKNISLSRLTL